MLPSTDTFVKIWWVSTIAAVIIFACAWLYDFVDKVESIDETPDQETVQIDIEEKRQSDAEAIGRDYCAQFDKELLYAEPLELENGNFGALTICK